MQKGTVEMLFVIANHSIKRWFHWIPTIETIKERNWEAIVGTSTEVIAKHELRVEVVDVKHEI